MRFGKVSWGEVLVLRQRILRARLRGETRDGAEIVERALVGRVPNGDFADVNRRLVTRAAAVGIDESPLSESEIAQLLADLQAAAAFDRVLAASGSLPLRTKVAFVSAGTTAEVILPGAAKIHRRIEIGAEALTPHKAVGLVVVQDFFSRIAVQDAARLLERELVAAVARETDRKFVELVTAGAPTGASTGDFLRDLAAALAALVDNNGAALFALVAPKIAKQLACARGADGQQIFPGLDAVRGGEVAGVQVLPTDGLTVNSAGQGDVVVCDALQLGLAAEPPTVSMSDETTVDLSDAPTMDAATGAGTTATSLWQVNGEAWRAERAFSATRIRDDGVFVISDAEYTS